MTADNAKKEKEKKKDKAKRYAQTAERQPMPRPSVFASKKAYNRKRLKAERPED